MKSAYMDPTDPVAVNAFLKLDATPVQAGHVELWPREGRVALHGEDIHLARREFEVLRVLVLAAGHVLGRAGIYEVVWGSPMPHSRVRSVDVHVLRVRTRLARVSPGWTYIHTHFGHGYRFLPVRAAEPPPR